MGNAYSADPKAIAAIGQGFELVGGKMATLSELGPDRLRLLFESCGDDEMGRELQQKLGEVLKKIEGALTLMGVVVDNQKNVANGLSKKLANMEHDNTSNIVNNSRRH